MSGQLAGIAYAHAADLGLPLTRHLDPPRPNWVLFIMRRRPVSVLELPRYQRRAADLLTEAEQDAVIDLVAFDPTCGDLIPGAGGLRKVRVGRGGSGKRGGARVIYYFYNGDFPAVLMALYAKNEKADLSARDKKELAGDLKEIMASWRRK
jgi:hypothetical protein